MLATFQPVGRTGRASDDRYRRSELRRLRKLSNVLFLIDHGSDCQNGLKAIVIVSEVSYRPRTDAPTSGNNGSSSITGSCDSADGQSSGDELVITLPPLPTIIALCVLGVGTVVAIFFIIVTCCYRWKKKRARSGKKIELTLRPREYREDQTEARLHSPHHDCI